MLFVVADDDGQNACLLCQMIKVKLSVVCCVRL